MPLLIPYADVPTQYGIVVERSPGRLTIKVPQLSLWRRPGIFVIGCFISCFIGIFTSGLVIGSMSSTGSRILTTPEIIEMFASTIVIGAIVFVAGMAIFNRVAGLRPAAVFEVGDGFLQVSVWGVEVEQRGAPRSTDGAYIRRWPIAEIGAVKGNLYGMGVMIRIIGKDMVELLHHHPEVVRVWIAQELWAALNA